MSIQSRKKVFQGILLGICVVTLGLYLHYHRDQAAKLITELGLVEAIIIVCTVVGQIGVRTICEKLHFASIGHDIPSFNLYGILAQQNILNYLPFKAGTLYTAGLLTVRYKIPISHYAAVFTVQNLLALGTTLIAAGVALQFSQSQPSNHYPTSAILSIAGILTFAILFVRIPEMSVLPEKIKSHLKLLNVGIAKSKQDPFVFFVLTALRLLAIVLMTWRFQILFNLSGYEISFPTALVLSASVLISLVVAITPAGLGIRELLVALTSTFILVPAAIAVIVTIMERILVLITSVAIVITGHWWPQNATGNHQD